MSLIGRLQSVADVFCASAEKRREQLSYQIFKDQRRLDRVFGGQAGITVESYENAMAWLSANWPDGAQWPEGVERPETIQHEAAE